MVQSWLRRPKKRPARNCEAMDLRIVNVRRELPAFYRYLGYIETGTAPFTHGVATKLPCHFIEMSKSLRECAAGAE